MKQALTMVALILASSSGQAHAWSYCEFYKESCTIPPDTIVCTTLTGIEASDYEMNARQLESLGCLTLKNKVLVKPVADPIGRFQQVKTRKTEKVILLWVTHTAFE
jgi:hypothetical protein